MPAAPLTEIALPSFDVFELNWQVYPVGLLVAQKNAPSNLQFVNDAFKVVSFPCEK